MPTSRKTKPEKWRFVRPWMPPELEAVIYAPERVVVIEGATKTGKTTNCAVWLIEMAIERGAPGRHFWWVSSVYDTAEIAYERLKLGLTADDFAKSNDSDQSLTLPNGAVCEFRSAEKPDNLYGQDVFGCVADEASRWREEAYVALRTTLSATRAPLRVPHNVKGRKNWAYRLARRAQAGEPDHLHALFTAYDAVRWGILDAASVEEARRDMPEQWFNELYLCQPADDGGNPFGMDAIRSNIRALAPGPPACWAFDLAGARKNRQTDWTVGIGLNAAGDVCAFYRWQLPWDVTLDRIVDIVGALPCLLDSTGAGDVVLTLARQRMPNVDGYTYTGPSKQTLMVGLAVDIQQHRTSYPLGPIDGQPAPIVDELEAFEYVYTRTGVTYSAPPGMHDDCVCALAQARYLYRDLFAESDNFYVPGMDKRSGAADPAGVEYAGMYVPQSSTAARSVDGSRLLQDFMAARSGTYRPRRQGDDESDEVVIR